MPKGVYERKKNGSHLFKKGYKPWNKGKHVKLRPDSYRHSKETLKKITKANIKNGKKRRGVIPKNLKSMSGKNHWNYKDGRSSDKKYRNWQKQEYNTRKKAAEGSHTFGEWSNLKAKYNWACPCCKEVEPKIKLTEDHIIPISKGGSNNIENIQPLCSSCNCKKHTKIIKY
jgi:5-methylcytosine-specific restriction endonuclease McrA